MRRKIVAFVGAAGLFAALAVTGLSEPAPVVIPPSAAQATTTPLLGLIQGPRGSGVDILARIDLRSLRPLRRPRTVVAPQPTWSYSPDRRSLALGVAFGLEDDLNAAVSLRVLDVKTLRTQMRVRIGNGQPAVFWVASDRIFVLIGHCCDAPGVDVVAVDPVAGKIISRQAFTGSLVGTEQTSDGLVLLLAPPHSIGQPRLVVLRTDGQAREVVLDRIQAGSDEPGPDADGNWFSTRQDYPGLAVDRSGGKAYVVSGDGPVAVVDLASLGVSYVTPASSRSPAKEGPNGPWRRAVFVGGILVVTGGDGHVYTDAAGRTQSRWSPAGLWLVDTSTWRERLLDPRADGFFVAGDELLATGYSWDSGTQKGDDLGLSAYGFDGALRFHKPPAVADNVWLAYGDRLFVNGARSGNLVRILDRRTGRVLGRRTATLPRLLLPN